MAQKAAIKSRIKSISSTKKITSAMELISSVKLQKSRNQMLKNGGYADVLRDTVSEILSSDIEIDNDFLVKRDIAKKFVFVFSSDLGLCGGYNGNIIKLAKEGISKDDIVVAIGKKNYSFFEKNGYNLVNELTLSDTLTHVELKKIVDRAIQMYRNREIGSIEILYTKFINNVTFEAAIEKVLPGDYSGKKKEGPAKETIFEPNANEILDSLIPMMVNNEVYSKFLQAKTSEQGSRRFAMENATDNAEELTTKLQLQFNKARQAAITQEITEIVSGADAL